MMGLSFGLCRVTLSRRGAMVPHSTPHSASVEETLRPSALGFRRRKVGLRRATVSRRLAIVLSLEADAEQTGRTLPIGGGAVALARGSRDARLPEVDLSAQSARAYVFSQAPTIYGNCYIWQPLS